MLWAGKKKTRLTINPRGLSPEELLELAAAGDYDPETGDLVLQLSNEQAREIVARIQAGLDDRSITEE